MKCVVSYDVTLPSLLFTSGKIMKVELPQSQMLMWKVWFTAGTVCPVEGFQTKGHVEILWMQEDLCLRGGLLGCFLQ